MAWYGNVGFKQRAIIEFLVTEKELVTNIHKRLKNLYGVNAVDRSTISLWDSRTAGFAKGQVELTRVALTGQQQQSLRVASTF